MRADRWFHTLVVVGAALPGCSGRTETTSDPANLGAGSPNAAGAGVAGVAGGAAGNGAASGGVGGVASSGTTSGGAPTSPTDCAAPQSFVCESYEPLLNCRCDPLAPKYASDCPQVLDFQCAELQVGGTRVYVACRCETPALTPDDCAVPESFRCNVAYPFLSDCHCDGAVVAVSDCEPGFGLCCQSQEPRFGCECCSLVIK
jgi:hypothetical protein